MGYIGGYGEGAERGIVLDLCNTPIFFQLKSKIRPIFANFEQISSVFGTIITNLTENCAFYALSTLKVHH